MPRVARLIIPDVPVHIVQRGHDRADCFLEEADYRAYLDALRMYATRFDCTVHAYCLMTNHVHLLLTPHESTGCAQLMNHVAQRYSKRVNARQGRSGTLWESRFYSGLVTTGRYALACYRYIELNPVRAGLVKHPADYRWSSYRANTHSRLDDFVSPHAAYVALGENPLGRAASYAAICDTSLEQEVVQEIRKATRGGYSMGGPRRPRGRPGKIVTVTIWG
jgi:putative transposase